MPRLHHLLDAGLNPEEQACVDPLIQQYLKQRLQMVRTLPAVCERDDSIDVRLRY